MNILLVFLFLIFAHYVGDYVFQSEFLGVTKGISWYNLLVHCILYTGTVSFAFYLLGCHNLYPIIIILFISHMLIDKTKCIWVVHYNKNNDKGYGAYKGDILYLDQSLHIIIIALLLFLL